MLRKNFREARIKEGVVFVPAFFISYLAYAALWYSEWSPFSWALNWLL